MKTEHTPEPWRIGTPPPNGEQTIGDAKGLMVAVATTGHGVSSEANARRIVACVNACAGIPTDVLEDKSILKADADLRIKRDALEKQRDELMYFVEDVRRNGDTRLANMAIAAIASVKEQGK